MASIWGAMGPVSVGLVIAACWGEQDYRGTQLGEFTINLVINILDLWPIVAFEALLGSFYGATRAAAWSSGTLRNVAPSVVLWAVSGVPFFGCAMNLEAFSGHSPERSPWLELLAVIATYAAHVAGGVIAGFQVDYFLRTRGGKNERGD